jgi:hypothetical protein
MCCDVRSRSLPRCAWRGRLRAFPRGFPTGRMGTARAQEFGAFVRGKSMEDLLAVALEWEHGLACAVQMLGPQGASRAPTSSPRPAALGALEGHPSPADAAKAFRSALSMVFSIVLVEDPSRARREAVDQRCWNVFYADINDVRQALGKARPLPTGGPSAAPPLQQAPAPSSTYGGDPSPVGGLGVVAGAAAVVAPSAPRAILNPAVVAQRKRLLVLTTSAENFFCQLVQRLWTRYRESVVQTRFGTVVRENLEGPAAECVGASSCVFGSGSCVSVLMSGQ